MSSAVQPRPPTPAHVKIEKQYKLNLIRRWFDFVWRTAVFTGIVTAVSTATITWKASTLILGFFGGLLAFPFILYPALAMRRTYIISPVRDQLKTSPFSLFTSSLVNQRTIRFIGTHATFALGFTFLYTQIINIANPAADFGLFKATARHPLHLNERMVFLLFGNVVYLAAVGVSETLKTDTKASWPAKRMPLYKAAQQGLDKGLGHLLNILPLFSWRYTLFAPLFTAIYWYLRRRVWFFAARWGLSSFVINWARHSKTNLSVGLIAYLYALIFASLVLLRLPMEMVNTYVTQPLSFTTLKSPLTADRYLLEALRSEKSYHLHFTLMELLRVVNDPSRRANIFEERSASPSSRSPLVLEIWQELLLQFGRSYKILSTRGGTLKSVPAPAPPKSRAPDPRAIQIKQADVFRPVSKQKSTISLALQNVLDGPVKPTPPAILDAEQRVLEVENKALKQIEGVVQETVKRIEGYEQGRVALQETKGMVETVFAWSGREWARRNVQISMPDPMIAAWLVDIFAALAIASASEDRYGYVQSVLPATLEAIVRYRSALLGLQSELLSKAQTIGRAGQPAAEEVKRLTGPSILACERGVSRIAERFGRSLSAFKFPPWVADSLSEICRPLETVEED